MLHRWENYLLEKRNQHYHLNNFNINQLTYLCKKLACDDKKDFPDQVYQLLARFASNISYPFVSECLDEVTKIKDEIDSGDNSLVQGEIKA